MIELTGGDTLPQFRPMLSAKFKDGDVESQLAKLSYPVLVSPKLDGIRVLCHPELGPVTRSLKPVRNRHIQALLSHPRLHYLDGEVVVGNHESSSFSFQACESAVMSYDGQPDFTYFVFDHFGCPSNDYAVRMTEAHKRSITEEDKSYVRWLPHVPCHDAAAILEFEEECLTHNYEGVMIRSYEGTYKFGRSTLREGGLIKLKRFVDAEAEIVGYVELYRNKNAPTRGALGLQTRSDHKAGMEPAGTLGALIVRGVGDHWNGVTFQVGSGLDDATRADYWDRLGRGELIGELINYRFQLHGSKDAPRIPTFRGLRRDI